MARNGNIKHSKDTGKRIRQRRLALNLTQKELSIRSGLTIDHISRLESGTRGLGYESLEKLTEILGVSEEYLTGQPSYQKPSYILSKKVKN